MNLRPAASLSPGLLARKGAARPAMRPQLQPIAEFQRCATQALEDLGWDDLGDDNGGHSPPLEIHPRGAGKLMGPLVGERRIAVTLRVDAQRHLKLRLASTIAGRSAQQLLTSALDHLLDGFEELEAIARQARNA